MLSCGVCDFLWGVSSPKTLFRNPLPSLHSCRRRRTIKEPVIAMVERPTTDAKDTAWGSGAALHSKRSEPRSRYASGGTRPVGQQQLPPSHAKSLETVFQRHEVSPSSAGRIPQPLLQAPVNSTATSLLPASEAGVRATPLADSLSVQMGSRSWKEHREEKFSDSMLEESSHVSALFSSEELSRTPRSAFARGNSRRLPSALAKVVDMHDSPMARIAGGDHEGEDEDEMDSPSYVSSPTQSALRRRRGKVGGIFSRSCPRSTARSDSV